MNQIGRTTGEPREKTAASQFFFVGNVLALDLLNTEAVIRGKKRDLLSSPEDLAALGYQSLEVTPEGELEPRYHASDREKQAVLLSIALSALRLLTQEERTRLRKCKNERCIGVFYDTTRSATRHWCTLECMNRARSVEHYRQAKREQTALDDT
jgi:predicted RNA-binding Zn ribbon-like protein